MNSRYWRSGTAALLGLALCAGISLAESPHKSAGRVPVSFGLLQTTSPDTARTQALDWLKSAGKRDANTLKSFDAIWAQSDRSVLDRVTETLALGDTEAAKLISEARDPAAPAPMTVPAVLSDAKKPGFYRSNLALAYGKALSNRKAYEEALGALKAAKAEQVVDPGTYLFHRAVAEHALMMKEDATKSIVRPLDDGVDVPERCRPVAVLT